jgi:hypothetical protein
MRLSKLGLVLLASLSLQGCKTLAGSETPALETTRLLDELPKVNNSTKAPCRVQREIAAQWSYIHTIKTGKETVYAAPCEVDKPKGTAPAKVAANG